MFKSANNNLIRTLTGTVSTCSLIVKRYIWNRHFDALEVKDDNLTGFLQTLRGKQSSLKEDYSMKQNEVYENFQSKFPGARLFCRYRGDFNLDSQLYTRSESNSFVSSSSENEILLGQILFSIEQDSVIMCAVQLYDVVDKIALDLSSTDFCERKSNFEHLGYLVEKSSEVRVLNCILIDSKLIPFLFLDNLYFIHVLTHFEHD